MLEGKIALVTGAGKGLGRAIAESLHAERAHVIAVARTQSDLDALEVDLGDRIETWALDATGEDILSRIEELTQLDILINNAGYSGASILEDTNDDIWTSDLNGNLNGAYFCARNVIDDMKSIDGSAIVNISSVNGLAALGDPAYSAAKAGIISLTKSLALEYGRYGIRANVICPGTVRTPIWDHRIERNPEILEKLVRWYPLRRVANPIDIVRTAMFLASDDAAAITGAVLPVDCGLSAGNLVMTREITLSDM